MDSEWSVSNFWWTRNPVWVRSRLLSCVSTIFAGLSLSCLMAEESIRRAAALAADPPAGVQGRCTVCCAYMHKWDPHAACITCSTTSGFNCRPDRPCARCKSWNDTSWALYLSKVKEVQQKRGYRGSARRALSLPGTPVVPRTPCSTPAGPAGPNPFGYPWTASMAGPWGPWGMVSSQDQADFYRNQLNLMKQTILPIVAQEEEEGELTCGQRSRSNSPSG